MNVLKTLLINLKLFSIPVALRFPIKVYGNIKLSVVRRGSVVFTCPVKAGIIKLGQNYVGTIDDKYLRTVWMVGGTIIVHGKVNVGAGSAINVDRNAVLELGDKFFITGRSTIIARKKVVFGKQCLVSWNVQIMDTDFHSIFDSSSLYINEDKPIYVGNKVWIGCNSSILKGVTIGNDVVIAAGTVVTKNILSSGVVYGGIGRDGNILRMGITWKP